MFTSNTWLGLCLGLSLFIVTHTETPKIKTPEERINYYVEMLLAIAPPYVWGGSFGLLGGDCSGNTYWVFHMAGIPVLRMRALEMWLGGWPGKKIIMKDGAWAKAQFPNIVFFTFKKERPAGHVAIVRKNTGKTITYAEASFSAKMYKETAMVLTDGRGKAVIGIIIVDLYPGVKK
jgi:hypothetical protein